MLAELALRWNRLTAVALLVIVVSGVVLFHDFPAREDPQFTVREATVTVRHPGMELDRMADQVVQPLEEAIQEIPEVDTITASVRRNEAIIHVHLKNAVFDIDPVWDELREQVDDTRSALPPGTSQPRINDDFGDVAAAVIALTADGFSDAEQRRQARDIRRRLYAVEGVGKVRLSGLPAERIYLDTSNAQLTRYGISPAVIADRLEQRNVVEPSGTIEIEGQRVYIEGGAELETLADIRNTVITSSESGAAVYLRDLAEVKRQPREQPEETAFNNGDRAVVLAVVMREGTNIRSFGKRLTQTLANIEGELPHGYDLEYASYKPAMVEQAVAEFTGNLYQTLGVVLVVVIAFLGLRTGIVAGVLVPLTMLSALVLMAIFEIPLHRVSIAALIVSMGLLIDNGIVITERIRWWLDTGANRRQAAIAAQRELALPLATSTATTVLFFVPLMMAEHPAGEYMRALALVVLFSLASSWLLAMTALPLLASYTLHPRPVGNGGGLVRGYQWLLARTLPLRLPVIVLTLLASIAAIGSLTLLPQQFFPPSDREQFIVDVNLPRGTAPAETTARVQALEQWLRTNGPVESVERTIAYAGYGGPRFYLTHTPLDPGPDRGFILVTLTPDGNAERAVQQVRRALLDRFPKLDTQVRPLWLGPVEEGVVEIRLTGPERDELVRLGRRVEQIFRDIGPMAELTNDWRNRVARAEVAIDQERAQRAGVTRTATLRSLEGFFEGFHATELSDGRDRIPVLMRGAPDDRQRLARLRSVNIYPESGGEPVPLSQVAEVSLGWGYGEIQRRNLQSTLTVSAKSTRLKASQLWQQARPAVADLDLPAGYDWQLGGELEESRAARSALFAFLPMAVGVMALILIAQFNSVRRTLIIALVVPLSVIGAAAGLHAGNAVFGFTTILGLLSLFGIVINNAIVMISRIDVLDRESNDRIGAIIQGSGERLRPILITMLTTSLGLLPLMLFGGELWYGLTIAIAAGLLGGTVLTLVVVPCLYAALFPVQQAPSKQADA